MSSNGAGLASATRVVAGVLASDASAHPDRPSVSVVIPVFDHSERLGACLASLAAQSYPRELFDVILVDNGCKADLAGLAARFPAVRVVSEPSPGSYAARNAGVHASHGAILAFTDADCVPAPDWIENGVKALLSTPGAGLVAGNIEVVFSNPENPTPVELYEGLASFRQEDYVRRWHFGATANLFTSRRVFERVGPFEQRLHSLGDREWGQRTWDAGYVPVYCASACVSHPARRTLDELLRRTARMAGGFYSLVRVRRWSLKHFLHDSGLGLYPLERLITPASRGDASLRPLRRRWLVAGVVLAILSVRAVELLRLLAGGRPRRA